MWRRERSLSGRQSNVGTLDFSEFLPVGGDTNNPHNGSTALYTPPSTVTPKYVRYLREDSGFGSLDKSQESSEDHDGSFQELLRSGPKANCKTPNVAETKRRPRLQRQHRLSTLKEGGSQSEEDAADKKHIQKQNRQTKSDPAHKKHLKPPQSPGCFTEDEVFTDATPRRALSVFCDNSLTCAKQEYVTPQRGPTTKLENRTPQSTEPSTVTPVRKTPSSRSLTPALELVQALCRQNALLLAGRSSTLKEQLKCSAGLLETQVTLRTTMPLAGLIGRKMGLGQVDILTELTKRNLRHILTLILGLLDSNSVCSFSKVCRNWDEIVQQDKQARLRKRNYLNEVETALENGGGGKVFDADTRAFQRSALKMVQAQARTSSFCTPQSGNRTLTPLSHSGNSNRRNNYVEVAKTLFSDECLKPCPKCESPARCHSTKREGVCSRADCAFQFCTSCLCSFHGSRECASQSAGRRTKSTLIPGSAESKRNIRRL
ncbi:F-box only protein 43 [Salarias fasciatus]|uniref:F-box only protein 43 n=1 Tax=Salarias fasciatus TaxID=181472 RepID=UPI0011769BE8|nr:F-box only protein 43 [Salarias fasciatus]